MNVFRGDPGWKFSFGTLEESEVISHNRIARGRGARPRLRAGRPQLIWREEKVPTDKPCSDSNRAGLCASCKHVRIIRSDRGSVFYLCRRSATDPNYAQYPRLPVVSCRGYEGQEMCAEAKNDKPGSDAEPSQ